MAGKEELEAAGQLLCNYATIAEMKAMLRAAGAPEEVIQRIHAVDDVLEWLTPERRSQIDRMSGDARWWTDLRAKVKEAALWITGVAGAAAILMQVWAWLAPHIGNHP